MASYNRVILVGNLTRDPQLSYLPSNTAVVNFGLATSHKWRGQDGQDHEDTCFVDCDLFGRGAEVFNQYMTKGRSVLVEGRLKFRQWETPEGQKRSKLSVWVDKFQFLGGPRGEGAPRAEGQAPPAARPTGSPPARAPRPAGVPSAQQTAPGATEEQPPPPQDEEAPPPLTEGDVPF